MCVFSSVLRRHYAWHEDAENSPSPRWLKAFPFPNVGLQDGETAKFSCEKTAILNSQSQTISLSQAAKCLTGYTEFYLLRRETLREEKHRRSPVW